MVGWAIIQEELMIYFRDHGLNVAVGLAPDGEGLVLRSQDGRVDMSNMGQVVAWSYPYE